jgi:hypothetical protein
LSQWKKRHFKFPWLLSFGYHSNKLESLEKSALFFFFLIWFHSAKWSPPSTLPLDSEVPMGSHILSSLLCCWGQSTYGNYGHGVNRSEVFFLASGRQKQMLAPFLTFVREEANFQAAKWRNPRSLTCCWEAVHLNHGKKWEINLYCA